MKYISVSHHSSGGGSPSRAGSNEAGVAESKGGNYAAMIHSRFRLVPALAMLLALAATGFASAAKAGTQVFQGIVRHISSNNIKVYNNATGKTQGFVLVPRFGNVFKADGRTPSDLHHIAAGDYVKVYFDQKFLGAYHADRILILNNANMVKSRTHG